MYDCRSISLVLSIDFGICLYRSLLQEKHFDNVRFLFIYFALVTLNV